MKKSNYDIKCPYCDHIIDLLSEEDFQDAFVKEETTWFNCPLCEQNIELTPIAIWSYKVKQAED